MRTSAALLVLVAAGAWAQPNQRFELGLPAEVTLVGLTAGVRPEVLLRPGAPGSRSRLRLAVGALLGPEQFLLPIALGYRAQFRQGARVQPLVGAGLESQLRFVDDAPPVWALGLYLEGGLGVALTGQLSLAAMLSVDVMVLGTPGFGLTPRLLASWRL